MSHTYGQLKDGKLISFPEFYNEVSRALKLIGVKRISPTTVRIKYENGVSIEDTISFLILNSK